MALAIMTAVTDANNHTTSYAYDSMNRLTTVTTPISGDTTVYGYSGGNQITVDRWPGAHHDHAIRRAEPGDDNHAARLGRNDRDCLRRCGARNQSDRSR